jgi:hypothetical protein
MRIAAGLLAFTLLAGCQSSPAPSTATAPRPAPVVTSSAFEVIPPAPRRPLARLNPRRQILEVGEAPRHSRPLPRKVGVRVLSPAPEAAKVQAFIPPPAPRLNPPVYYAPPVQAPSARIQSPSVPVQGWPPPARAHARQSQAQVEAFMAQEQERIRQNNEMLLNRPTPGGGMTPEMQRIAYPQANIPQIGPSAAHQAAERRYLEARADFLNTKYLPNGMPPRYTPDNVRGLVGTGMALPPTMMNQPAMYNPVLQKAQQAEVLRQEMQRTP